uniref:DUF2852 domain-containing protein n=2 Tax=Bursaphelenchus xylophilus TaxID=6326 RepID=A0A1I7S6G7_BURXY
MAVLLILFWNLALTGFWFSVAAAGVKRTRDWWKQRALENREAKSSGNVQDKNETGSVEYEKVNQESGTKILKKKVRESVNAPNAPKTPDNRGGRKRSSGNRKTNPAQDQLPSLKS